MFGTNSNIPTVWLQKGSIQLSPNLSNCCGNTNCDGKLLEWARGAGLIEGWLSGKENQRTHFSRKSSLWLNSLILMMLPVFLDAFRGLSVRNDSKTSLKLYINTAVKSNHRLLANGSDVWEQSHLLISRLIIWAPAMFSRLFHELIRRRTHPKSI